MRQDEGMIVGSTSAGAIFACIEIHNLPYMELRSFRVNAGVYILMFWHQTIQRVICVNLKLEKRYFVLTQKEMQD